MRRGYRIAYTMAMDNRNRSDIIDQLIGSYLKVPVSVRWKRASGLPFPDTFIDARLEFQGIATAWLNLEQVAWEAREARFLPGFPAKFALTGPSVMISVGQAELDRWVSRFQLPYRLELGKEGLTVHTRIAGFPLAEFETRLEVIDGWFILQPQRASILGVPSYVASLFRTYLPLPPLSSETKLAAIEHDTGVLRLRFDLGDFEEEVSPGILARLRKRFFPLADQIIAAQPKTTATDRSRR